MSKYLKYIFILYLIFIIIILLKIDNDYTILFENFNENDNNKSTIDISEFYVELDEFNNIFETNIKELPYCISAVGIDINNKQQIYIYNKSNSLYLNRTIEYWMNNIHDSLNKSKYFFIICYNDAYKFDEIQEKEDHHTDFYVSFAPKYKNDYTVFTFAKRIDDKKSICIPDPYFTFNNAHFQRLNLIDRNFIKWSSKINECTWRGTPTYGLNTNFFNPKGKDDLNQRLYFIKLFLLKKFKNFSYEDSYKIGRAHV